MASDRPEAVILVGNYPPDQQFSMQGVFRLLRREIEAAGIPVLPIRPEAKENAALPLPPKYRGHWDKLRRFPRRLRETVHRECPAHGWDPSRVIVHIVDHGNAIYATGARPCPVVVTCHDTMAIRRARGAFSPWAPPPSPLFRLQQRKILQGLEAADAIACVSESTRDDLLQLLPGKAASIRWFPHALPFEPELLPEETIHRRLRERGWDARPYCFHLGNNSWYKNRSGLLRIYHALVDARTRNAPPPPALICAGAPFDSEQLQLLQTLGLEDQVLHAGRPSEDELQALYRGAQLFLFPSHYEGMGLPPLEAQRFGVPVVAADRPALQSVLGDSAILRDPEVPETWVDPIRKIFEDPAFRQSLVEKGRDNWTRFRPEPMRRQYLDLYRDLLTRT